MSESSDVLGLESLGDCRGDVGTEERCADTANLAFPADSTFLRSNPNCTQMLGRTADSSSSAFTTITLRV